MLSSASCSVGTKSGFTISFTLNFLLSFLEEVKVDEIFPLVVGLSDEGFGSVVVVSALVRDLVGDLVGDLVRVFLRDFLRDLVKDFSGSISIGQMGSFVEDGGGV